MPKPEETAELTHHNYISASEQQLLNGICRLFLLQHRNSQSLILTQARISSTGGSETIEEPQEIFDPVSIPALAAQQLKDQYNPKDYVYVPDLTLTEYEHAAKQGAPSRKVKIPLAILCGDGQDLHQKPRELLWQNHIVW